MPPPEGRAALSRWWPRLTPTPGGKRLIVAAAAAVTVVGAAAALLSSAPSAAPRPGPACAPAPPPAADVDDDGCEEPVSWAAGVLQAGPARFAFGVPGDRWAVGDWDCDGVRTPALLHDGALTVFDAWPAPGAELRGRQVAQLATADGVSVVPGSDGCDRLSLRRPGAGDLVVDVRNRP
jgi:hypothetical protein